MKVVRMKGGEGSGNFNHAGIPGHVGGSAPSTRSDLQSSETFKTWFGNSKVVDETGKPLIVYHGTGADFTAFNPGKSVKKSNMELAFGIHFATSGEFAGDYYASDPMGKKPLIKGGNVKPVYLSIQNLLVADKVYGPDTPEYALAKKLGGRKVSKEGVYLQHALDMTAPDRAERIVREAGYDGIRYEAEIISGYRGHPGAWQKVVANKSVSYVVFDPKQIKSAIGNSGEYSIDNPDITKEHHVVVLKGGPTSGNHGHHGRPGMVGGSAEAEAAFNTSGPEDLATIPDYKVVPIHYGNAATEDYQRLAKIGYSEVDNLSDAVYKNYDSLDKAGTFVMLPNGKILFGNPDTTTDISFPRHTELYAGYVLAHPEEFGDKRYWNEDVQDWSNKTVLEGSRQILDQRIDENEAQERAVMEVTGAVSCEVYPYGKDLAMSVKGTSSFVPNTELKSYYAMKLVKAVRKLNDSNKLPEGVKYIQFLFTVDSKPVKVSMLDQISKIDTTDPWELSIEYKERKVVVLKGGPNSGNHGHAGRPGAVGGSAPARGSNNDLAGARAMVIPQEFTIISTLQDDKFNGKPMTIKFEWYKDSIRKALADTAGVKYSDDVKLALREQCVFDKKDQYNILNSGPEGVDMQEIGKPATQGKGPESLNMFSDMFNKHDNGQDGATASYNVAEDINIAVTHDPVLNEYIVDDGDDRQIFKTQDEAHGQAIKLINAYRPIAENDAHIEWEKTVSYGMRGQIKDQIVKAIAAKTGLDYNVVDTMERQWAATSNGSDMRSLSLQDAVAEEMGSPLSKWQSKDYQDYAKPLEAAKKYHADSIALWDEAKAYQDAIVNMPRDELDPQYKKSILNRYGIAAAEWRKQYPDRPALSDILTIPATFEDYWKDHSGTKAGMPLTDRVTERKFVRAMYENTQAHLAKLGYKPNDTIRVFRGVGQGAGKITVSDVGTTVKYKGNAAESWSLSTKVAASFGDYMLAMEVPVKNILSTARTGWGCIDEGEVVLIGNQNVTASVLFSKLED